MNNRYKWYVLILAALTDAVTAAAPLMALAVLLPEIAGDLNLTLVQAGVVWGIGGLPVIISGLIGGTLGDRFGPKRILIWSCLAVGLVGALRGISPDYLTLLVSVFLFGFITPMIIMNNVKTAGDWFPSQELGFANGALAMGMASGFLLGSMLSASVLSPLLGGWRNVFIFYGVISALFAIPWIFVRPASTEASSSPTGSLTQAFIQGMAHVASIKNIWLLGLGVMGISGSIQGLLGYLPLHLRSLGWESASAAGAVGAFHTVSMLAVLPIALWSDRIGSRKAMLITMAMFITAGLSLLSFVEGSAVWGAVMLAGVVRDGFMAIFTTAVIETRGVGIRYTGTAMGFSMIFIGLGNLLAPPIGNSMAGISPGAPFMFWTAMSIFGILCITLTKTGERVLAEA